MPDNYYNFRLCSHGRCLARATQRCRSCDHPICDEHVRPIGCIDCERNVRRNGLAAMMQQAVDLHDQQIEAAIFGAAVGAEPIMYEAASSADDVQDVDFGD